jgi:hypothetical protein
LFAADSVTVIMGASLYCVSRLNQTDEFTLPFIALSVTARVSL